MAAGIRREQSSAQRRRHPRFQVAIEITATSESQFWAGTTTDISEGGVFVATTELKPIGTEIELTIKLPGHLPVSVHGEVRWIRETKAKLGAPLGMGIQFRTVPDESLRVIREFLAKRPAMRAE
jgi:uncharacterized protein (TIGR02266 family)